MTVDTVPLAATVPADAHRFPLSHRLLCHVMRGATPECQRALRDFYAALPTHHFNALEADIAHTLLASKCDLQACLHALDRFIAEPLGAEGGTWPRPSAAYTSMQLDAALPGFSRRRLVQLRDRILSRVRPVRRVLEVGCGSGYLSGQLVDAKQRWQLTLIDRSAAALAFVEAYHRARGTGHRVTCRQSDMAQLPAEDASFDAVIAAEVLEMTPDVDAATGELVRVLRPGGWLAVSVPLDLEIVVHQSVLGSEQSILAHFKRFGMQATDVATVRPCPRLDAIARTAPDVAGCINAVFQKPGDQP